MLSHKNMKFYVLHKILLMYAEFPEIKTQQIGRNAVKNYAVYTVWSYPMLGLDAFEQNENFSFCI